MYCFNQMYYLKLSDYDLHQIPKLVLGAAPLSLYYSHHILVVAIIHFPYTTYPIYFNTELPHFLCTTFTVDVNFQSFSIFHFRQLLIQYFQPETSLLSIYCLHHYFQLFSCGNAIIIFDFCNLRSRDHCLNTT